MQYQQPLQPVSIPDAQFYQPKELFNVNITFQWLQQAGERSVSEMLFGKFWVEGELRILFTDNNFGKSRQTLIVSVR
jgi:hypothetical protein